jgi:hypothetical protein
MWGGRCHSGQGQQASGGDWLLAVNGFYRLTRGTYEQFGRPVPCPEAAYNTVWAHCQDSSVFGDGRGTACEVLDVVHPLYLCSRQSPEMWGQAATDWVADRLDRALGCWLPGQGFAFDPAKGGASLQGTEMWLSIVYLMAKLLGLADQVGYRPEGIHKDRLSTN